VFATANHFRTNTLAYYGTELQARVSVRVSHLVKSLPLKEGYALLL
jgi:hypothetical protein